MGKTSIAEFLSRLSYEHQRNSSQLWSFPPRSQPCGFSELGGSRPAGLRIPPLLTADFSQAALRRLPLRGVFVSPRHPVVSSAPRSAPRGPPLCRSPATTGNAYSSLLSFAPPYNLPDLSNPSYLQSDISSNPARRALPLHLTNGKAPFPVECFSPTLTGFSSCISGCLSHRSNPQDSLV